MPTHISRIAVGFSGGADSFALLHMTCAWAKDKNILVYAFTVDHGLRAESADEAAALKQWCTDHHIAHETLQWIGAKPTSALQDSARKARRQLLCDACMAHDIPVLLLGHQRNDQAETILMRLLRGTGLSGLRAMVPFRDDKGITIMRPLLQVTRQELRAYCSKHHLPFVDDPSNENTAFERVRMRNILKQLPELSDGINITLKRLSRADEALDRLTTQWLDQNIRSPETWFAKDSFAALEPEIGIRVLSRLFEGSQEGRVRLQDIEHLYARILKEDFSGATLGSLWIRPKIHAKTKGFLVIPAPPRQIKT